jgi:hypothetical protein
MLTKTTTSLDITDKDGAPRKQIVTTYTLWGIALYRKTVDKALIRELGIELLP